MSIIILIAGVAIFAIVSIFVILNMLFGDENK